MCRVTWAAQNPIVFDCRKAGLADKRTHHACKETLCYSLLGSFGCKFLYFKLLLSSRRLLNHIYNTEYPNCKCKEIYNQLKVHSGVDFLPFCERQNFTPKIFNSRNASEFYTDKLIPLGDFQNSMLRNIE